MDPRRRMRDGALAAWRGLILHQLSVFGGITVATLVIISISMISSWVGILLVPPAVMLLRGFADFFRRLARDWTGTRIDRPYLPFPPDEELGTGFTRRWHRTAHVLKDRATWRDLLWTLADPFVSTVTAALPAVLIVNGVYGLVLAGGVWTLLDHGSWYLFLPLTGWAVIPAVVAAALIQIKVGFLKGPALLGAYGRWSRVLLAPTEKSRLALRVQRLTETRSDAVDAQAAELRRIERDLHDGAQARLVAMGMSLGAIEHLLDKDPEKARILLAEARESSAKALGELRDLVRGIHPPVLADRGLVDAVRALALDHPLRVEVTAGVPGRLDPPVESAAYFAMAEVLTNAAKHSGATRVWVDIRHENGHLRMTVTDDGHGGASLGGGTGLRGIERRIGTFDGVLALSSPPGGPTIVTMELPCALSSQRTSPS